MGVARQHVYTVAMATKILWVNSKKYNQGGDNCATANIQGSNNKYVMAINGNIHNFLLLILINGN